MIGIIVYHHLFLKMYIIINFIKTYPLEKDVIRIHNYMNYFTLYEEGDYYVFVQINQSDIKVYIIYNI